MPLCDTFLPLSSGRSSSEQYLTEQSEGDTMSFTRVTLNNKDGGISPTGTSQNRRICLRSLDRDSQAGPEEANSNVINCLWRELRGRELWVVSNTWSGFWLTDNKMLGLSFTQLQGNRFCQQPEESWKWIFSQLSFWWRCSPKWHLDCSQQDPEAEIPAKLCLDSQPMETVK